jgi:hypothetical protein
MLVAVKLIEPRRSTVCDAISAENDGSEASFNDGTDAAVATYSMDQPLATLMGPEHPAGNEIAEHGCGDERNRDQDNGNAVATFQFTNRSQSCGACQDWRVPLGRRSSTEEEGGLWRQIANSEAQQDEAPEKPGADPAGTLC